MTKRLVIFIDAGFVAGVYTPDDPRGFQIILHDVDARGIEERPVRELPPPTKISEKRWRGYRDEVDKEEEIEDE